MATIKELLEQHNILATKQKQPLLKSWKQAKTGLIERINTLAAREAGNMTIGGMVKSLVMDPKLSYDDIVTAVKGEFPMAKTSRRSVASTAADLRKTGAKVPLRKKGRPV